MTDHHDEPVRNYALASYALNAAMLSDLTKSGVISAEQRTRIIGLAILSLSGYPAEQREPARMALEMLEHLR